MGAAKNIDYILLKLDELPTLPTIVYELTAVINNPLSSTKEVEDIMNTDQSMTTKVLKLVNSAYYAIPGGVSNLARAIAYLGYDTVHQLVLSTSVIKALKTDVKTSFDVNEFWKHSIGVGIASEAIAKFTRHPTPSDLFTCGLLHDMGKMAIYCIDPDTLVNTSEFAIKENMTYFDAEARLGVPNHTDIGRALTEKWVLPTIIQSVVKHHHQPDSQKRGGLSGDLNKIVDIVCLSDGLIVALKFGNCGHQKVTGIPKEIMRRLMISDGDMKPLINEINNGLSKAEDFIRTIGS